MDDPTASGTLAAAPGLILGGFRLMERVGAGGMGEVWKAENVQVPGILRAVKVIRPELAAGGEFRVRFLREAELTERLKHENILRVDNIGEEAGRLFMLMELLSGDSADHLRGKLSVEEACRIVWEASRGIAHAHRNGIIHRDIKPANLFVTSEGSVRVLDFGIARHGDYSGLTKTASSQPGSPAYYAPEFVEGKPSSPASDVYAMGVTLYELLTGKLPFQPERGVTESQAILYFMNKHATAPLPDPRRLRPEVPAELAAVVSAATVKDPAKRLQDGTALATALERFAREPLPALAEIGSSIRGGTRLSVPLPAGTGERRSSRAKVIGGCFVAGLLLFGVAIALRPHGLAPPPEGMVRIEGGTFAQGRPDYGVPGALDVPAHPVTVQPFALMSREVTIGDYKKFVDDRHVPTPWSARLTDVSGIARMPAVNVPHADAEAYCEWRYPKGRLPTESEWERAARGLENHLYPWGDDFKKECTNGMAGDDGALQEPGSHPCGTTPSGLMDLSGNAWEWTSSPSSAYPGSQATVPPADGRFFMARGGSFYNTDRNELTATAREFLGGANMYTGFRCATTLP